MICSTVNFSDYLAIPTLIQFWNTFGEQIFTEQNILKKQAFEFLLNKLKWHSPNSSFSTEQWGPMFSFQLPDRNQENAFHFGMKLLLDHKIQVSITNIRGKAFMRVSPHIYNDMSEIERLGNVLNG
jgi:selenocysteine lyase/cysteine desulfurase